MTKDGDEPVCLDGKCPVGFDLLPEEAIRILKIRGLLGSLGGLGLADKICREYEVTLEDLELLDLVETETRALRPEPADGRSQG